MTVVFYDGLESGSLSAYHGSFVSNGVAPGVVAFPLVGAYSVRFRTNPTLALARSQVYVNTDLSEVWVIGDFYVAEGIIALQRHDRHYTIRLMAGNSLVSSIGIRRDADQPPKWTLWFLRTMTPYLGTHTFGTTIIGAADQGRWIHVKLHYSRATGLYELWVDGRKEITYNVTPGDLPAITRVEFGAYKSGATGQTYDPTGEYTLEVYGDEFVIADSDPEVPTPLTVAVTPASAGLQIGQSQTFTATVSGGLPPYYFRWIDAVSGAVLAAGTSYVFYAQAVGSFGIIARASDSLAAQADSPVVPITVTEVAPPPKHVLGIASNPGGVYVTVGTMSYVTPVNIELEEGTYGLRFPAQISVVGHFLDFGRWENGNTNPIRTINLVSDISVFATYPYGVLNITTVNVIGSITTDGVFDGVGSASIRVKAGVPHTIQFGPVTGFVTPPPKIVTIYEGQTLNITGVYQAETYSVTLTVTSGGKPAVGAKVRVRSGPTVPPEQIADANGQVVFTGLLVGTYVFVAIYQPEGQPIEYGTVTLDPSKTSSAQIVVTPTPISLLPIIELSIGSFVTTLGYL